MAQKTYVVTGKHHRVQGVKKELADKHHIPVTETPDGKLIIDPKDAKEENAVITAIDNNGARIVR